MIRRGVEPGDAAISARLEWDCAPSVEEGGRG